MSRIEFNEKNVKFKSDADCWEDAIREGCQMLLDNGHILPAYIDGIISAIKEFGPYIVITDGLAIPHTRPENGAKSIGFSLITFKNPIKFDEETFPVKVMICFSAIDKDSHLEILKMIVEFVEGEKIDKIAEVESIKELLELIN